MSGIRTRSQSGADIEDNDDIERKSIDAEGHTGIDDTTIIDERPSLDNPDNDDHSDHIPVDNPVDHGRHSLSPPTPDIFQTTLANILRESVASPKGTDVRSPDKFNGLDRSKFRTYIAQCRLVFRANPRKFDTDTKQVTYACSYLDGLAFQWYQNFLDLDEDPLWFDNWSLFKKELQAQFGEVNVEATAERNIRTLNMKHGDQITTYITKFHTFANNLAWNDEALVSEFRRGLAPRIKDELQHVDKDNWTLRELQDRALRIDYRYWERQNEKGSEHSDHRPIIKTVTTSSQKTIIPRDHRREVRQERSTRTSYPAAKPSSTLPLNQDGHIKDDERQRRIDKGLCLYCGDSKHLINDCPKKPKDDRFPRANTRMATATFAIQGKE
jgi:hypothetical protein